MHPEIDLTLMQRFCVSAERALPGRAAGGPVRVASAGRGPARVRLGRGGAGRASSRDTLTLADAAYDLIVESGETIHPVASSEDGLGVRPLLLDRIAAEGIGL